jgi:Skp family chaperone for outer membrane proteins
LTNREADVSNRTRFPLSRFLPASAPAVALVAAALALAVAGGCDKKDKDAAVKDAKPAAGTAQGGVAVVDFDRVFKELGWSDEITQKMQGTETSNKMVLETFGRELGQLVNEKKYQIATEAKLTDKQRDDFFNGRDLDKLPLTQAQKEDLGRAANYANAYHQRAQQRGLQILQDRQAQLFRVYKDSTQPAVRRVADNASMTVVVTPASAVYFNPTVDLTNKVIEDLRAAPPPHNTPDPPKLQVEQVQLNSPPPPTTGPAVPAVPTTGPASRPR